MHQKFQRVSLKKVAELAQVSVSTASQALRGDGRIAPSTRERVMAAAKEVGYQRHALLSHLAARKFRPDNATTQTLIVLLPHQRKWSFEMIRWVDSCRVLASGQGFRLDIVDSTQINTCEQACQQWIRQGVCGLLIGNSPSHLRLSQFPWQGLAVVVCGGYHLRPLHHMVKLDVAEGLVALTEKAQEKGYQRIGYAMMRHDDPVIDDWIRVGLAQELARQSESPVPVYSGSLRDQTGFMDWFREHQPDVVIGFPQVFGYWIESEAALTGRRTARLYLPASPGTGESGWVEDQGVVAEEALRQLIECVQRGETKPPATPRITLISGYWHEGETCPPRPTVPLCEA